METAAVVEIKPGCLRRYSLDDFHRCLKKSAEKRRRLFHSYHRPDGGSYDNNINFSRRLRSTLNKLFFGPKNGEPLIRQRQPREARVKIYRSPWHNSNRRFTKPFTWLESTYCQIVRVSSRSLPKERLRIDRTTSSLYDVALTNRLYSVLFRRSPPGMYRIACFLRCST